MAIVTAPAISTEQVTKRFGKLTAVNELTIEVLAGQVVGFLGPNGAGKTTTIRMLMGFIRPTSGRATILGGQPAQPSRGRRSQKSSCFACEPLSLQRQQVDLAGARVEHAEKRHGHKGSSEHNERRQRDPVGLS